MEHIQRLIAHMSWADRAALEALRRADGMTARTLAIFAHILGAEHVWLARGSLDPIRPDRHRALRLRVQRRCHGLKLWNDATRSFSVS